nr:MAG TPA_asm: hypothetical protein [Caudoviricetes sp.]
MLPTCCIVEATRLVSRPMPPAIYWRHRVIKK